MQTFFENIEKLAPLEMPCGYRIHIPIGEIYYHLFADRCKKSPIWKFEKFGNRLIEFSEYVHSIDYVDLFEFYVNSLFTAEEVQTLAEFFFTAHRIESIITPQIFPMPLPKAYFELIAKEDGEGYDEVTVGDESLPIPLPFSAFLYDLQQSGVGVFEDSESLGIMTWKERRACGVHSFTLVEHGPGSPVDFSVRGYSEPVGQCFIDYLKNVHTNIDIQNASPQEVSNG